MLLDPRYQLSYESSPTLEKCKEMINFISMLVTNMRSRFCFDDLTNLKKLPQNIGDPKELSLDTTFHLYRKRITLALNITVLDLAEGALLVGDDRHFNDAFLGIGPIHPSGNWFDYSMRDMVSDMRPFHDTDFKVYPSIDEVELFGSVLVETLVLVSPLFRYFPYGEQVEVEME